METLKETAYYKIYWYDDARTIIVGDVYPNWTWQSAYEGLAFLNDQLAEPSKTRTTYSIIYFSPDSQMIPQGGSALAYLQRLIKEDPHHEALTIYVVHTGVLTTLMQLATKLYGINDRLPYHRFVTSMSEALQLITEHQKMVNH